jgi:hypothetical protein
MTGEIVAAAVVHPATGEVLDVLGGGGDQLAEWHDQLAAIKRAADAALHLVDGELRKRMGERTLWPTGTWEVGIEGANESVWDADELEVVLRHLVETGAVQAGAVTEVIRHQTVVSRSEAGRLAKQLTGRARDAVEACRTWQRKPGRIVVKRSVALPSGEDGTT